jgi:hypothetical protein
MPLSIYDTLTMLGAIEMMPPEPSFLWDTFVQPSYQYSTDELVAIDYRKGGTRLAPFVASDVGGIVVDRPGYNTALVKFPTIAPERLIRAADIRGRAFGEAVFSGRSPADREAEMLAQDLIELRRMIALRRNWMVAQLLFVTPGKLLLDVMTDKGLAEAALSIDYAYSNNITIAVPWTDPTSNPMSDVELITDSARDTGGANPDIIIMAPDAARAYRDNVNVRQALDITNLQIGSVQSTYSGDYLKYTGRSPNGLEMYSYSATYLSDDGTVKPLVPSGTVAALSRSSVRAMFGPVIQLEPGSTRHTVYTDYAEVPLFLPDYRKNTTGLRLTSRPIIAPENVDGWAVAKVL